MQLAGGRNRPPPAVVLVIFLQVLAGPFRELAKQLAECQTVRKHAGPPLTTNAHKRGPAAAINWTAEATGRRLRDESTIIVSDHDSASESFQQVDKQANKCHNLAKALSLDTPEAFVCLHHSKCPSAAGETGERARRLACALSLDGSVRICCKLLDRSASTLGEDEQDGDDDVGTNEEQAIVVNSNDKFNSSQAVLGRQKSSNETVIITDNNNNNKGTTERDDAARAPSAPSGGEARNETPLGRFGQLCGRVPSSGGPESQDERANEESRIINGETARKNAWPWFALVLVRHRRRNSALMSRLEPECGATLISDRFVLTAAHCVVDRATRRTYEASQVVVRLGEHDLTVKGDGEQDFQVKQIIAHARFHQKTFRNDIALLELGKNVSAFGSSIAPACLAQLSGTTGEPATIREASNRALDNHTVWVLGFGQTSYNGRSSDQLRQADLRIVPQAKCKRAFAHLVRLTYDYVCASSQEGLGDEEQVEERSSQASDEANVVASGAAEMKMAVRKANSWRLKKKDR